MNEAAMSVAFSEGTADALTHALLLAGSGFYASFRTPTSLAFRGLLLFFIILLL